jgi:hypothetical protein
MAIYALVSEGLVVNTIKADADFIPLIEADYAAAVDVTAIVPQPSIGWAYSDGAFVAPAQPEVDNGSD